MTDVAEVETRIQARLAWNNWPDNADSRRQIAASEDRDPFSAAAWDRVILAIRRTPAPPSPIGGAGAVDE